MRVAAVIFENPPENSEPFAEACLRFSPTISLKKHGVLFIEIGGSRLLFDEIAFSARMQVLLRRFQLSAKIQIANTLLEALILAEHGTLNPEKLSTRAFLDFADPFRSDPKIAKNVQEIVECLHQVGVKTIARFLNVPTGEISARFGSLAIFIKSRMTHEIGLAWPLWVPVEKNGETDHSDHGKGQDPKNTPDHDHTHDV